MSNTFTLQLQGFVDKVGRNAEQVVRKVGIDIYSQVIMKSPVDTGRFRANWNVGASAIGRTSLDVDKAGTATAARGTGLILRIPLGEPIWLTNSLPYARRLEYGWSTQAPAGMVRVTVAEWNKFIEAAVKALP